MQMKQPLTRPYTATAVAKYIINYATDNEKPTTHLQLQELLYLCWVEYYKTNKCYLFDSRIEAWQYGPVTPEVYYEYYVYPGMPLVINYHVGLQYEDKLTLNKIIDKHIDKSIRELMAHRNNHYKAWSMCYAKGERKHMPFRTIISYDY